MPDPLTLTAIGGLVAAEGIKFLYNQASELLKAWRERRRRKAEGLAVPERLEVPVVPTEALDGEPLQHGADPALLEATNAELIKLAGALAPYAEGMVDIDLDDASLAETAGRVRSLLEAAFGERFTFRGEQREPTGTTVTVRQDLGTVAGTVIGADGNVHSGASLAVEQTTGRVEPGASVTGWTGEAG